MKSKLDCALELAAKGFYVFPLVPGAKTPAIQHWTSRATRETAQLNAWWSRNPNFNIGIYTGHYGDNEALLVVDIDMKGEKNGKEEMLNLKLEGKDFPQTFKQSTPSGGEHLIYRVKEAVKQGTDVLASGVDIRSKGGYIVGPGSSIQEKMYVGAGETIVYAPDWLIETCGRAKVREENVQAKIEGVDQAQAKARAIDYLEHHAPFALEGDAGDQTTFIVACQVKDLGVSKEDCFELLMENWNHKCVPPWHPEDLQTKIANAYRYGVEPVGISSPEASFQPVVVEETQNPEPLHPFEQINKEFAFVLSGGGHHILWETTDSKGNFMLEHLTEPTFHKNFASKTMVIDGKFKQITQLWMSSPERRSYKGICFMPGQEAPEGWYNLWKGFAVEPLAKDETPTSEMQSAVSSFKNHAHQNVCGGDDKLFAWLMGYFAHLIQKPWEKPLVALVFRGSKGVGKNALIDRVGHLLGGHYILTADKRYLTGNFNGHLENNLMLALDEAFWSGDKQAEGIVKNLITGNKHVIEHKGKEPYTVENCTRVVVIGNEDWLVPATQDERRFAVFNVGDGRKQDRSYFREMREGMERGGYRLLLRYLLDYDLSKVDVDAAPSTVGLLEQKLSSLDPFYQWWFDCLTERRIVDSDLGDKWPDDVDKDRVRNAYRRYTKERNIRSRTHDDRSLGKLFRTCLPSLVADKKRRDGEHFVKMYRLPSIDQAHADWDKFIGHKCKWD